MRIICTVTNDLNYDQRMQRIGRSLVTHGYAVQLVGRQLPQSSPLVERIFEQKRLRCWFHKGFAFYAEYNIRLFFYLLTAPYDAVCSIDLDTLAAGCLATLIRSKKRVFDAHEYFTEVPEVVHRPVVKAFWSIIGRICLRWYRHAYTVGPALATIFEGKYKLKFAVVRNTPQAGNDTDFIKSQPDPTETAPSSAAATPTPAIIFYQGALNVGRGLEAAIGAMQRLEKVQLWLAGEGDLSRSLRQLTRTLGVQDKVNFLGMLPPETLKGYTTQAWLGLNLLENRGLSYYYSLTNKFFDYVQAAVPALTMNYPEYQALQTQYETALLINELSPDTVAAAVRLLQSDTLLYTRLQNNCLQARPVWTWEQDEKVLLDVWNQVEGKKHN